MEEHPEAAAALAAGTGIAASLLPPRSQSVNVEPSSDRPRPSSPTSDSGLRGQSARVERYHSVTSASEIEAEPLAVADGRIKVSDSDTSLTDQSVSEADNGVPRSLSAGQPETPSSHGGSQRRHHVASSVSKALAGQSEEYRKQTEALLQLLDRRDPTMPEQWLQRVTQKRQRNVLASAGSQRLSPEISKETAEILHRQLRELIRDRNTAFRTEFAQLMESFNKNQLIDFRHHLDDYPKVVLTAAKDLKNIKPHWIFDVATRMGSACSHVRHFVNRMLDERSGNARSKHLSMRQSTTLRTGSLSDSFDARRTLSSQSMYLPDGGAQRTGMLPTSGIVAAAESRPQGRHGMSSLDKEMSVGRSARSSFVEQPDLTRVLATFVDVTRQLAAHVEAANAERRALMDLLKESHSKRRELSPADRSERHSFDGRVPNGSSPMVNGRGRPQTLQRQPEHRGSAPHTEVFSFPPPSPMDEVMKEFLQSISTPETVIENFVQHVSRGHDGESRAKKNKMAGGKKTSWAKPWLILFQQGFTYDTLIQLATKEDLAVVVPQVGLLLRYGGQRYFYCKQRLHFC